ncbi:hypothetical protein [uncultured Ferrovibrio sp.]|jgi:hypothetical protein|uniref:hypothetical protein n=1 Tax=uncultured Ferrovibrio sp. TaxID=1576913 RepID=UPI00261EBCD9|nr:hypothetical protein [uncultured Ferrovibrio sp.]
MAIALLSLRQAERVEPELKAALKAGQATAKSAKAQAAAPLSARERLALREAGPEAAAAALSARQFVQQLSIKEQEATRAQMIWALGRIEPSEIDTMIKALAKMRGRYASLVLEYSQSERPIGNVALEELRGLRERIEEFERGLETIKAAILDGTAEVAGVKTAAL